VARNALTQRPTHPYDIHEILVSYQKIDLVYRLVVLRATPWGGAKRALPWTSVSRGAPQCTKSSYRRCGTLARVLALALCRGGLHLSAVHKNVPAFANAVTLATENTKSAFETVEQTYEDVQAERIVVNYDNAGLPSGDGQPVLGSGRPPGTVELFSTPCNATPRLSLMFRR